MNAISLIYSLDKDDSCNGSKTQSCTTTESNTPENTVRLDNLAQKSRQSYHMSENGEVITESKFCYSYIKHFTEKFIFL